MATATRRAKKSIKPAKDPDNDVDPDDSALETLLEALKDSDKSLGELRRDHGLAPEAVVRLMAKHSRLLEECPITEKIKLRPGITTTISRVREQAARNDA